MDYLSTNIKTCHVLKYFVYHNTLINLNVTLNFSRLKFNNLDEFGYVCICTYLYTYLCQPSICEEVNVHTIRFYTNFQMYDRRQQGVRGKA